MAVNMDIRANTTPWAEHIINRVASGPVALDVLLTEASALVPPGRAYRAGIYSRDWIAAKNGRTRVRQFANESARKEQRIRYGQREIAKEALRGFKDRGRVIIDESEGVEMVHPGPNIENIQPIRPHSSPAVFAILRAVEHRPVTMSDLYEQVWESVDEKRALASYTLRGSQHGASYRGATSPRQSGARNVISKMVSDLVKSGRILRYVDESGVDVVERGAKWTMEVRRA